MHEKFTRQIIGYFIKKVVNIIKNIIINYYFFYFLFQVHVNLMIMEARNQAELLYALREIMRYRT